MHLIEKQKYFIASLMQEEISKAKGEIARKNIRDKYKPFTLRDLKAGRGKWNITRYND